MRVCVFVDGENFRHSLVDVLDQEFDQGEYLPKGADWSGFFDWLVPQACGGPQAQRLRTYWYVLEHVDFFPYKLPKLPNRADSLRVVLNKDKPTRARLARFEGDEVLQEMGKTAQLLKEREQTFLSRFRGWHVVQDGIANAHRAIEFRRAGAVWFNLFRKQMGQEKAVDVKLAADLITLRDIYDTAVIVSGDQDYVPAVQVVKDFGKTVVNVAFKTRDGRLLPGGARRLANLTDSSFEVPFEKLRKFMGLEPVQVVAEKKKA